MTDETAQAFAHPEARARATAEGRPVDRISLRDHVLETEIGAFQQERGKRQRLRFNVVVEVRAESHLDDDVDRILSYDRITEAIATELEAERLNLLETLAERIAWRILAEPRAQRCFVRIEKLDRGPGALGVEIVRSHAEDAPRPSSPPPAPQIHHLCGDADAGALAALIEEAEAPLIVTCTAPTPAPRAAHPAAQRRIDLLAIEQQAWRLSALEPRLLVVATRTEIDWALRAGQPMLWAPSKLVLDATHPPARDADARALSDWLAHELGARAHRES